MNSIVKTILKYLLFLGIGILLVWLVVRKLSDNDINEIKHAFSIADYRIIALSCVVGLFSHLSRALRWKQLLEAAGHNAKLQNTFLAVLVGYLANLAFPRLGEVTRCAMLKQYDNVPLETGIGTVVTERLMDTLTMLGVVIIVLLTQYNLYYGYLDKNVFVPMQAKATEVGTGTIYTVLAVSFILMVVGILLFRNLWKKTSSPSSITSKPKEILRRFMGGLLSVAKVEKKGWLIFHSIFIWVLYLCTTLINFRCLPATSGLGLDPALALLAWGTFGFVLVQGGIGAYQLIAIEVLSFYLIDRNTGFAMGWIIWSAQTFVVIVAGAIAFFLFPVLNKNNHGLQSAGEEQNSGPENAQ